MCGFNKGCAEEENNYKANKTKKKKKKVPHINLHIF